MKHATGTEDGGEALHILGPFGVVEAVEDARVDDGRERAPHPIEREHVTDLEGGVQSTLGQLAFAHRMAVDGRARHGLPIVNGYGRTTIWLMALSPSRSHRLSCT